MRAAIYWIDDGQPQLGRLGIMARPRGGEWLDDELRALRQAGVNMVVSLLTTAEAAELDLAQEGLCCAANELTYINFPIPDRQVPELNQATLRLFNQLADQRAAGKALAIHCRMGIGRSSLVAASLLALAGLSVEQAFERIRAARGCPVPDTPEQRVWVERFARQQGLDLL